MMRFFVFFKLILFLTCCNKDNAATKVINEDAPTSKAEVMMVDKIHQGMAISEVKELYPGSNFISEPVNRFGVDGEDSDGDAERDS